MSHSHLLMLTIYVANFPNVKKVTVFVLVFVFVIAFKLVSSCHLIILIKCLGSLFEGTIFAFVFVGQVSSSHIFHGISLPPWIKSLDNSLIQQRQYLTTECPSLPVGNMKELEENKPPAVLWLPLSPFKLPSTKVEATQVFFPRHHVIHKIFCEVTRQDPGKIKRNVEFHRCVSMQKNKCI